MKFKLFEKERDLKLLKRIGITIVMIACLIVITNEALWWLEDEEYYSDEYSYEEGSYENCNVAIIDLKGFLDTDFYEEGDVGSSDIVWAIEDAEISDDIKAIILDVDSGGGYLIAGEEISNALSRAKKPTVALIRSIGTSAAYLSAIGSDVVFASKNSDVGSIGVTISYLDNVKQNQMEGLNYNQLSAGKYKDMMSSDKPLTYEEKLLIERDLKIMHENFIEMVAEKRNLDIGKVRSLADGSSMMGQMALDNGLIDYLGDFYDVRQYLADLIDEEVVVCW